MAKAIVQRNGLPRARRRGGEESSAVFRPDLGDIKTHFNEALALLVVCQRSMVENDSAVHEEIVIRTAIAKFRDVYEGIDLADFRMRDSRDL